ncbi:UDP-N-acetylmuramate dehydrogenase [Aerococcaceae bacterium DSM 111022]|nr:UDP-N-acetylmuramate dehydrogenase [Aerococcaceae bacterium DSM 111022]
MKYELLKETYPQLNLKYNEPLSKYSYTKTGGPADVIAFPKSVSEVKEIVNWAKENDSPITVLGNLSNLIVRDGGMDGIVVILTDMNSVAVSDNCIIADSGATLIEVTHYARDYHLTGLEFACGIPGSMGGAIFMNAGAYGGEMRDIQLEVDTITLGGELKTYKLEECEFAYRHSVFQDNGDIILTTRLWLEKGDINLIQSEMDRVTDLRVSKQPLEYPSCGSVFKRPEGYFAGKLIQDAGLQGHRIGGAEVSKKHAGFIVNIDNATATDYVSVIRHIQKTVWEKDQVRLETEVRILGREVK